MKKAPVMLLCSAIFLSMALPPALAAKEYTVRFETQYGYAADQTVEENETATKTEPDGNSQGCFRGWLLDGEKFDFNTPITENITLTADWQEHIDINNTESSLCTESETKKLYCTFCDEEFTATLPPRAHNLQYYDSVAATCTRNGKRGFYECIDCGALFSDAGGKASVTEENLIIPTPGHNWEEHKEIPATCKAGTEAYKVCTVCGQKDPENAPVSIQPTGQHAWVEASEERYLKEKASCTAPAAYYKSCKNCLESSEGTREEETFTVGTVIPHSANCQVGIDATCLTAGNIEYYECELCHRKFSDDSCSDELTEEQIVLPAKHPEGHEWNENGDCRLCSGKAFLLSVIVNGSGKVFVDDKEISSDTTAILDPTETISVSFVPGQGMAVGSVKVNTNPETITENRIILEGNSGEAKQLSVFFDAKRAGEPKITLNEEPVYHKAAEELLEDLAVWTGVSASEIKYALYDVTPVWEDGSTMSAEDVKNYVETNGVFTFLMPEPNELTESVLYDYMVAHFENEEFRLVSESGLYIETNSFSLYATYAIPQKTSTASSGGETVETPVTSDNTEPKIREYNLKIINEKPVNIEVENNSRPLEYIKSESTPEDNVEGTVVSGSAITIEKEGRYFVRYAKTENYPYASEWTGPVTVREYYTVQLKQLSGGKGSYEITSDNEQYDVDTYLVRKGGDMDIRFIPDNHYWLYEVKHNNEPVTLSKGQTAHTVPNVRESIIVTYRFADSSSSPKTEDNNRIMFWIAEEMILLAVMTAIVFFFFHRKETD